MSANTAIPVYQSVRSIGVIKPVFDSSINGFQPPTLQVYGTGFWVKEYRCFVTCAHVVDGVLKSSIEQAGMLVVGGNGHPYIRATVSIVDWLHDLAVLKILDNKNSIEQQVLKDGLDIANADPSVSEPIAYAGFPFGNQLLGATHLPTYSEGIVGKTIQHIGDKVVIQMTAPVVGGYSGSPVVLKASPNVVVGVVSRGPVDRGNTGNVIHAVHWQYIRDICVLASRI